jgi:hypothetical protein
MSNSEISEHTNESETETDRESQTGSQPENVADIDMTEYEDEDEDNFEPTMEAILGSTLSTTEGDTVCSALVNLGYQMEIQNKILVKLLSVLQKK